MNWSKSNKVLTKTKYNIHVNQLLGTRYTPTVYIYMYMYLCLYWTFLQCKTIISREDQQYGNALRKDWATSTSQSHYNSTIWVRGIASSSSSTTNASRPVSSAFFFLSPRGHLLWYTSHVGSLLFQGTTVYKPSSSSSPIPLLTSNQFFHRLKSVVARDLSGCDDSSNLSPAHTSTDRRTNRLFIALMSYSAGQSSLLSDERVCAI